MILSLLTILAYINRILYYGRPTSTSMQFADHANAFSQANCFIYIQLNTQLIRPSVLNENMPKFKIVRS